MNRYLVLGLAVVLALGLVTSAVLAQTAFNQTGSATCERKDPFDEYIYHTPFVNGMVVDGDLSDWARYGLLEWAPINHYCEGTGQEGWPISAGGWNYPPDDPDDFSAQFKAAWGRERSWPVLYLLVDITDDEIGFDGLNWEFDALQMWYSERLYDYDETVSVSDLWPDWRQMNVWFGAPDGYQGIYVFLFDGSGYFRDEENQPYSRAVVSRDAPNHCYIEISLQMFESYAQGKRWRVIPGRSCLALGISGANDRDSDGSFTYLTWGLCNQTHGWSSDMHSTFGFERNYAQLFGPANPAAKALASPGAAQPSTWGQVKSLF